MIQRKSAYIKHVKIREVEASKVDLYLTYINCKTF